MRKRVCWASITQDIDFMHYRPTMAANLLAAWRSAFLYSCFVINLFKTLSYN